MTDYLYDLKAAVDAAVIARVLTDDNGKALIAEWERLEAKEKPKSVLSRLHELAMKYAIEGDKVAATGNNESAAGYFANALILESACLIIAVHQDAQKDLADLVTSLFNRLLELSEKGGLMPIDYINYLRAEGIFALEDMSNVADDNPT